MPDEIGGPFGRFPPRIYHQVSRRIGRGQPTLLYRKQVLRPAFVPASLERRQVDGEGDQDIGFHRAPQFPDRAMFLTADANRNSRLAKFFRERRLAGCARAHEDDRWSPPVIRRASPGTASHHRPPFRMPAGPRSVASGTLESVNTLPCDVGDDLLSTRSEGRVAVSGEMHLELHAANERVDGFGMQGKGDDRHVIIWPSVVPLHDLAQQRIGEVLGRNPSAEVVPPP